MRAFPEDIEAEVDRQTAQLGRQWAWLALEEAVLVWERHAPELSLTYRDSVVGMRHELPYRCGVHQRQERSLRAGVVRGRVSAHLLLRRLLLGWRLRCSARVQCGAGVAHIPHRCVPAECRTDSDCGAGSYCSPTYADCSGVSGWYRRTAKDTCLDDSDCGTYEGCLFDNNKRHWTCAHKSGCM